MSRPDWLSIETVLPNGDKGSSVCRAGEAIEVARSEATIPGAIITLKQAESPYVSLAKGVREIGEMLTKIAEKPERGPW